MNPFYTLAIISIAVLACILSGWNLYRIPKCHRNQFLKIGLLFKTFMIVALGIWIMYLKLYGPHFTVSWDVADFAMVVYLLLDSGIVHIILSWNNRIMKDRRKK